MSKCVLVGKAVLEIGLRWRLFFCSTSKLQALGSTDKSVPHETLVIKHCPLSFFYEPITTSLRFRVPARGVIERFLQNLALPRQEETCETACSANLFFFVFFSDHGEFDAEMMLDWEQIVSIVIWRIEDVVEFRETLFVQWDGDDFVGLDLQ